MENGTGPSSRDNPRSFGAYGWEVDVDQDKKTECVHCGADIYMVWIVNRNGEVKRHPADPSTLTAKGARTFMRSHFGRCAGGLNMEESPK